MGQIFRDQNQMVALDQADPTMNVPVNSKHVAIVSWNEDESQLWRFTQEEETEEEKEKIVQNNVREICHVNWVVPYHPDIAKLRLSKIAQDIMDCYDSSIKIRIAWKNQMCNIGATLRSLSRDTG